MSLDTVLKIGNAFRSSDHNLQYFKYVVSCPRDKNDEWPLCITIPVNDDFTFNWDSVKITPENKRDQLYYLKFKTSNSDGLVKYVFGDIYFEKKATIKRDSSIDSKEGGFYRLADQNRSAAYRLSSFHRGINDYQEIVKSVGENSTVCIEKFHNELEKNIKLIERILCFIPAIYYFFNEFNDDSFKNILGNEAKLYDFSIKQNFQLIPKRNLERVGVTADLSNLDEIQQRIVFNLTNLSIFIHFEFPGEKHWYQFDEDLSILTTKLLSEFVEITENGVVFKKALYKTLCSGDKKNDIQFPNFLTSNKHKSKQFQEDTLQDLFYALDFTDRGKLISGTDTKLIILPQGDNLTDVDYKQFFEKKDEAKIVVQNENNSPAHDEPLFDFFSDNQENITAFDLIFCKRGGVSSPDKDLIELSGLKKSHLKQIRERIEKISNEIFEERQRFLKTEIELKKPQIEYSFLNVLGYPQIDLKTGKIKIKPSPKYKSHLIKVLPLIYTGNYYHDDMLLSAFIQNIEYAIRSGDNKFNLLKFDLKFLFTIQNLKEGGFMKIIESESYQIGILLGILSKNLSLEINSFDKKYVGNLTRRIGNIEDLTKFKNEIEEKLIMHDKTKFTYKDSYDLSQKIKNFNSAYDKDKCVFGFMESFFKPVPKKNEKQSQSNIEAE